MDNDKFVSLVDGKMWEQVPKIQEPLHPKTDNNMFETLECEDIPDIKEPDDICVWGPSHENAGEPIWGPPKNPQGGHIYFGFDNNFVSIPF